MTEKKQESVSAQVVLRSASGKLPRGDAQITAETLEQYSPSKETVDRTTKAFSDAGFQVGAMVGNSFSITAPVPKFEKHFKTRLRRNDRGGIECIGGAAGGCELPLNALPDPVAKHVVVVTFTPPPDFGPTNFGP